MGDKELQLADTDCGRQWDLKVKMREKFMRNKVFIKNDKLHRLRSSKWRIICIHSNKTLMSHSL